MTDPHGWPELMKPETAANFLDISVRQLSRLREAKKLPPPVALGDSPRYRREDLEAHVKRLKASV